mmetsp:Transcript_19503/g.54989  ORF Transcript_19503/g.54989 Transcript_19503/m.54989 type:complete len:206 (-) Transcript_19503:3-620(-)
MRRGAARRAAGDGVPCPWRRGLRLVQHALGRPQPHRTRVASAARQPDTQRCGGVGAPREAGWKPLVGEREERRRRHAREPAGHCRRGRAGGRQRRSSGTGRGPGAVGGPAGVPGGPRPPAPRVENARRSVPGCSSIAWWYRPCVRPLSPAASGTDLGRPCGPHRIAGGRRGCRRLRSRHSGRPRCGGPERRGCGCAGGGGGRKRI